jgi:thiol:disulfide interchange protein DsbD
MPCTGLILFAMGIGIGVPLLLLVTVGNRFLPKPGTWMNLLKGIFGFLFLATAMLMIRPVLDVPVAGPVGALADRGTAPGASEGFGHRHAVRRRFRVAGVVGRPAADGAAGGSDDPWQPLQVAVGSRATPSGHDAFTTINDPADLQRQLDSAKAQGNGCCSTTTPTGACRARSWRNRCSATQGPAGLSDVRLLRLDVTADNAASRELLGRYKVQGRRAVWIGPTAKNAAPAHHRRSGCRDFLQRWTRPGRQLMLTFTLGTLPSP